MKKIPFAALWLLLTFFLSACPLSAQWKTLQPGLEYRHGEGLHFFRMDPAKMRLGLLTAPSFGAQALTAERYCEKSGALLAVNGGFFDENFHSLGLLVNEGKILNPSRDVSWGIFLMGGKEGRTPSILPRNAWDPKNVRTALQVGPRLVIDGNIPTFKESGPTRRSAVGITANGLIEIAVSEKALTLREWAQILKEDCPQALNLDGGGSTQISAKVGDFSLNVSGATAVPNAVAVFRN